MPFANYGEKYAVFSTCSTLCCVRSTTSCPHWLLM